MRSLIACVKLFFFALLCAVIIPIQTICLFLFKNNPLYFVVPKIFNRLTLFIFRIKINVIGNFSTQGHVIYVGNHLSYIDIPVLGGTIPATFIAKADVRGWPVFGTLATISRTIYIERNRSAALQAIEDIESSLTGGRSLILFPEGTSTRGTEVLPFKSSLFELFLNDKLKQKLSIQPFTLSILETDGKALKTPEDMDIYAWHSNMELPPHLWALAKSKGAKIQLEFYAPRAAKEYDDRKKFAHDCHVDVANALQKRRTPS